MNWYIETLKNYAKFKGRAERREFWCFSLINAFVFIFLVVLDASMGAPEDELSPARIATLLFNIAIFIPGLAVTVRRLHDSNRSGW
jgi:uncharacterized membrane protein YhaH (DUF805 family)